MAAQLIDRPDRVCRWCEARDCPNHAPVRVSAKKMMQWVYEALPPKS